MSADPKIIRAWAVANGYPELEGKRGRLPVAVIAAYDELNNALPRSGGTGTPVAVKRPAAVKPATAKKPCVSVITLPLGIEAKEVIAAQDGLCSGCENPATEVVSVYSGQYPQELSGWTGLCGQCLCEWRKPVK